MFCNQNAGQEHSLLIVNKVVAKIKYLRTTVTNQNSIHVEIKSRLNLGNACYHYFHSILSSHLFSKNLKIKLYKIIILPVALYGCETWCLTLREKHNLRVFEYLALRGREWWEAGEDCNEDVHNLYALPNRVRKSRRMRCVGHAGCMER
jgi:hypothetical protein